VAAKAFLADFVTARQRRVEEQKARVPFAVVRAAAESRIERRDFTGAISPGNLAVIAELKQASPSRGTIRSDYHPQQIARSYESAGASALSVLTEEEFFRGSLADLKGARESTRLPVLRKDFIIDEYQIYESVAAGADALLLIVAALRDRELRDFLSLCGRLKIAALVETHTEENLRRAVGSGAAIIGINNRDLTTLEVNVETSFRLREEIPSSCLAVSESGIRTADDLSRLAAAGFDAVLIGEHLLLQSDPGKELARLLAGTLAPGTK
jgi:indole-3-glycerol phosphate synthase